MSWSDCSPLTFSWKVDMIETTHVIKSNTISRMKASIAVCKECTQIVNKCYNALLSENFNKPNSSTSDGNNDSRSKVEIKPKINKTAEADTVTTTTMILLMLIILTTRSVPIYSAIPYRRFLQPKLLTSYNSNWLVFRWINFFRWTNEGTTHVTLLIDEE